jgi:hypothetical protein
MSAAYRVIWKHFVLHHDIASFVYRAMEAREDVGAITEAMAKIDQLLAARPNQVGESRGEFDRILIVEPLAVDFEVYEEEKIVYVARARYAPRRRD